MCYSQHISIVRTNSIRNTTYTYIRITYPCCITISLLGFQYVFLLRIIPRYNLPLCRDVNT